MSLADVKAFGESRAEFWRNVPRGTCGCGREGVILYEVTDVEDGGHWCADCYPRHSARDRVQTCDNCGGAPAIRDPLTREDKYLCLECHRKDGYIPGDRAMISRVERRSSFTHSRGRKAVCEATGHGTDCKGEIKQRGAKGMLCNFHHNPKAYR